MVARLEEKLELLQLVQKKGGIVRLLFNKKKGNRAKKPDSSDYLIKGFSDSSKAEKPIHVIVCPADNPERIFSMDGGTKFTEIECGSRIIAV